MSMYDKSIAKIAHKMIYSQLSSGVSLCMGCFSNKSFAKNVLPPNTSRQNLSKICKGRDVQTAIQTSQTVKTILPFYIFEMSLIFYSKYDLIRVYKAKTPF